MGTHHARQEGCGFKLTSCGARWDTAETAGETAFFVTAEMVGP